MFLKANYQSPTMFKTIRFFSECARSFSQVFQSRLLGKERYLQKVLGYFANLNITENID